MYFQAVELECITGLVYWNKMKNNNNNNDNNNNNNNNNNDHSLSWLGTDTSINSGGVKLVLWTL
jgi:hypothetical protein